MTKYLTILIVLTLFGCGPSAKQKSEIKAIAGWKTVAAANYSMQYPSDWVLNQSGQMGTSLILLSPLENKDDQFTENVNLIVQDLSGKNIDLDKFSEISESQIEAMITNSTIIESKRVFGKDFEYHVLIYNGDQGLFKLKFEQYYWLENDKAYVLTFTCEQNKFSQFKDLGEKIMNTFTLNNQ
jgi:hypothetical protein